MQKTFHEVKLGRSRLKAGNIGFELGPLQHMSYAAGTELFSRAVSAGVTFFDLGMPYEELDKKIGHAMLSSLGQGGRDQIVLAGSFVPCAPLEFKQGLKKMLRALKTDHIDLCQIHDPDYIPRRGDAYGFFDAMVSAREAGLIRSIGITTGTDTIALHALEYGWYDTMQYPWTSADTEDDFLNFAHEAHWGTISVPPDQIPDEPDGEVKALGKVKDHVQLWPLTPGAGFDRILEIVSA